MDAKKKSINQTISVQGDSAPPTSQVGDLLILIPALGDMKQIYTTDLFWAWNKLSKSVD